MRTIQCLFLRLGPVLFFLFVTSPALTSTPAPDWTEGVKTLLCIRVKYPDVPAEPISVSDATTALTKASEFYRQNSYGKLSFRFTVTPTLRLPHAKKWYADQKSEKLLAADARALAKAAGYDPNSYQLEIITQPGKGGAEGAHYKKGVVTHMFDWGTIAHELGHNFGLYHNNAGFWQTSDNSIIGPGKSVSRGNPFDRMGHCDDFACHFNTRSKNALGWLPDSAILTVTNSGVYRIQAHDFINSSGVLALKIPKDAEKNYWIEFRQSFTTNPWLMNGIVIYWNYNKNTFTDLLDMTPGSSYGAQDAPLQIGRTFTDHEAGITITPLRKIETTSPASVEISIVVAPTTKTVPPNTAMEPTPTAP